MPSLFRSKHGMTAIFFVMLILFKDATAAQEGVDQFSPLWSSWPKSRGLRCGQLACEHEDSGGLISDKYQSIQSIKLGRLR